MSEQKKYREWILWCVVLAWGANYVIGKWGMIGFDPLTFTVLRFIGATPILFILLYLLEKDIRVKLKDCVGLAVIGLVGITIYQTLFMTTVKYASATNASLLLAISPVFTAIFAWMAGQESLGNKGRWGSALAFLGVTFVMLFGENRLAMGSDVWFGDLIGLLATSIWGFYPVLTKPMLAKYSALKTVTYSALFGTIFLFLAALPRLSGIQWQGIPTVAWGSLLYSIGPVTAFGLVAWYHGISKVGTNRVMAYMYLIPFVAVVTAVFFLGERMHLLQIVGAVGIFAGIRLIKQDKEVRQEGQTNRAKSLA
jgi:drug/metabolite transporter (DMT)-like permease